MSKTKALIIILIALVATIAVARTFKILLKNKALAPLLNQARQERNINMAEEKKIIRQPAVAGAFYPGSKAELEKMIEGFLANVKIEAPTGTPKILIVPHAGYVYSGQVAAYSFNQLEGLGIKQAIVIGPSHQFPVSGLILSSATHWQTPLGLVKVADVNSELAKKDNFEIINRVHDAEHALEVEIPFLQVIDPNIEIVPIIVGQLTSQEQADFAGILSKYLDAETALIVSVDLSHYHPYDEALALDNQSIDHILNLDSRGILTDEIDASWAVAAVLQLAKQQGWEPKLLKYANSGDVTGDKSGVVGYAAVGFYSSDKAIERYSDKDEYSEEEKQELLKVARTTIEQYLEKGKTFQPQTDNPKFKENRGVFVTLHKHGQLRGCIGYIQPIKPLIEAVRDNAISAAVHDTRFSPVKASELEDIEIEISILTVPQPDTLENIIKNKYGVVLQQGSRGATYLPQVWEDLPDSEEFFSSLCLKAGLSSNCWQDKKTQLLSYRAIVFHE